VQSELLIRFLLGGAVVVVFAMIGDLLKPKSFAGIFGAAPSVALATLGLTFATEGAGVGALEARSMMAGALALLVYSLLNARLLLCKVGQAPVSSAVATGASTVVWLVVALGLWWVVLR
jgi:hypothetical protein